MAEPIIYEYSAPGRCAASLPAADVPFTDLPPAALLREDLPLPEVTEQDLVRHYVHLSQLNYGVDVGFYPLGSCTMKYNPKVNEDAARLPGFTATHPYQPEEMVQGNLRLMWELQEYLMSISGFSAMSLQPAAGAHGELTGVLMIRAYHQSRGDAKRTRILIPDSAHGTNPASTVMAGFDCMEIKTDARGNVDLNDLRANLDDQVAGMMLTNPNTLGLFDENILDITRMVHEAGGLMYGDGANLNALLGIARPADLGFDVMHINLHKTFSTPHGGGGPGAGPVGATEALADFLPGPIVIAEEYVVDEGPWDDEEDDDWDDGNHTDVDDGESDDESLAGAESEDEVESEGEDVDVEEDEESIWEEDEEEDFEASVSEPYFSLYTPPQSIGRVKSFFGQFGMFVRAYTYIRMLGEEGLRATSEGAVLNANYLQAILKELFPLPHDRLCMHEFVLEGKIAGVPDVRALDISKRLIDYGIHPPTNYFPLIVPEALMIEPTETESKRTLDIFVDTLKKIVQEAHENPQLLHDAPVNAPVGRLDEVRAARNLILRWQRGT